MSVTDLKKQDEVEQEDMQSLKGTLFSTLVFVGGGITLFIVTLFFFFMIRF